MRCLRCSGSLITSTDGPRCLSCGWEPPAPPPPVPAPILRWRIVTPQEVARWRERRNVGWTYQELADADGRDLSTVGAHVTGKLKGRRYATTEEVALRRAQRAAGWTYERIAAGSEWSKLTVYMRLNGRFAPRRSRFVRPAPPPRMDGPRRVTPEEVARWREQRAAGWTYARIAEADDRDPSTVYAHVNSVRYPRRSRLPRAL